MEVQYQRFNSNQGGNCPVTPLPLPQSLYGRTDGRTDGRSYGHVITKFSRLDGLPNFLTHGAPLARFARWSSAIKGAMYNFQKVGVWVQVRISRCIKCEEATNYMLVDIYMLSTFLSLLLL